MIKYVKIISVIILSIIISAGCSEKVDVEVPQTFVEPVSYTVRERREAFLIAIWGELPGVGHLTDTPYDNINFERTIILSFDDIFFITLAMIEQHPYLINKEEESNVSIANGTMFNLNGLPGNFSDVKHTEMENGEHYVNGTHNGIPFTIKFEEV